MAPPAISVALVSSVHRHCGRLRTTVNAFQLWEACRRCFKHLPSLPSPKAQMEAR